MATVPIFNNHTFAAGHFDSDALVGPLTVPAGTSDCQLTYSIVSMPNATDTVTIIALKSLDNGASWTEINRSTQHGGTVIRNSQPVSGPLTGSLGMPVFAGERVKGTIDVIGSTIQLSMTAVLS